MLKLFVILIVTYLVRSTSGNLEPCQTLPSLDEESVIHNISWSVNFSLHDGIDDISNHSLTITFSWDLIINSTDYPVDGYIYCFGTTDGEAGQFPDESNLNYDDEEMTDDQINYLTPLLSHCGFYIGQPYWITDRNGTYRKCRFPCADYIDCFQQNGICSELSGRNCKPLDKDRQNITISVEFGKQYAFNINTYKGLESRKPIEGDKHNTLTGMTVFCGHHLIENENLPQTIASEYCQMHHPITGTELLSGVIVNFAVVGVSWDFNNNETIIVISWTKPHDFHQEKKITGYSVVSNATKSHSTIASIAATDVNAKTVEEEDEDPIYFYSIKSKGVVVGQDLPISVTITPHYKNDIESCRYRCRIDGKDFVEEIVIKAYDPCMVEGNGSFCDSMANCTAFSNPSNYTDWCHCPAGYVGDGVHSSKLDNATGCLEFNACFPGNPDGCVNSATCIDEAPPSMGVKNCHCPTLYFGDGRAFGSGCQPYGVIPIVLVPLLIMTIIWAILRQKKKKRDRLLEATLSQFVSKNTSAYTTTAFAFSDDLSRYILSINNHNNQVKPVFGSKLEIDRTSLVTQDIIGRGNFGVVHKATLERNGEEKIVAVKSLTGAFSSEYRNEFLAEISLLLHLGDHENILGVIGVCTVQHPGDPDEEYVSPLLITEFMIYGDLLHFLWNARDNAYAQEDPVYDFTEKSLFNIGHQVAHGLQYMTQSRVIHGDVAARNILVGENLRVKISDFGLANDAYRYGLIKGTVEKKVPFKWVSPERMTGGSSPITWKSDVWSFGILLYEMVTLGASPYPGMDTVTIYTKLQSGYRMPQPSSCSNYLYEIMRNCWEWSATKRPGFKDLEKKLHLDEENIEMCLSYPLLTRIDHLNEINSESYDRVVERRDSAMLAVETSIPSDGTSSHCHDAAHDVTENDVTSKDVISRDCPTSQLQSDDATKNDVAKHDIISCDGALNGNGVAGELSNGQANGSFVVN